MKNKTLNTIGLIVFFLIVFSLIVKNILDIRALEKESRFTIGEITKIEASSGGYRIYFRYNVLDKEYEPFSGIYRPDKRLIGKRFYVKFSPSNPSNCKLLLDKPVSDHLKEAPPEGWIIKFEKKDE